MAQFQFRNYLVRYNFLDRDHFPFETKTDTDFDIVLMAPHDTKQACRKRVNLADLFSE